MALGAYEGEAARGNVLNALAHPTVVNPLQAIMGANQAFNSQMEVRKNIAQNAVGQAYQQATDPQTGQVDYPKFRSIIAGDPRASMGMAQGLIDAGNLSTNQLNFNHAQQSAIGGGLGAMISQPDANQTPGAYDAQLKVLLNSGAIDANHYNLAKSDLDTLGPNPSAQDLRTHASRWLITSLSNADIANTALPRTEISRQPQGDVPTVVSPPRVTGQGGGQTLAPGGVRAGTAPGDTQTYMFQPTDANGKPSGAPYQVTAPKGTVFPQMQGTTITPVAPPAGGGGGSTAAVPGGGSTFPPGYTGRGVPPPPNANLANPNKPASSSGGGSPAPSSAAPPAPPPAVQPQASTPIPGGQGLVRNPDGTVGTPGGGGLGTPAAPASRPAAPSPSPTPTPTPAPAPASSPSQPPAGGVATSVPMGTEETLNNDIKARTDASLGRGAQQQVLQAGEDALDALRLAKGYTGPGTDFTSRAYAFLQAHDPTGALPQGNMTDTAWRQVLAKNLITFAQSSGLRGNTDLGLSEQLKGSPNVSEMLPAANEDVLIRRIGQVRQRIAETALMPPASVNGDVVKHFQTYTGNTDSRGFAWDKYDQKTRDAIEAEAKKSGPAAVARLTKAIHDGIATGVTQPPGTSAPAAAAPPAAAPTRAPTTGMVQPNPLTPPTNYAAATPNALAA